MPQRGLELSAIPTISEMSLAVAGGRQRPPLAPGK